MCLVAVPIATWYFWNSIQCWRIRQLLADARVDEALLIADNLAADQPQCSECQFLLAKAARRSGNFSSAASALQKAEASGCDVEKLRFEQVLAIAQSGQIRRVEGDLQRIFASRLQASATEEVYEAMAYGHLAAFDVPEFLKCVQFWQDWRPEAITPRLMRAGLYSQLGNHSAAAAEFAAVVQDHPDSLPARRGWGESLLALNLTSDAAPLLQDCFDQQPSGEIAVSLAKCLVAMDAGDQAKAILLQYRDTPDILVRSRILEELGRWYLDRNEAQQAINELQQCIQIAPENSSAWHALSAAYSLQGLTEEAARALTVSQETQHRCQRLVSVVSELADKPDSTDLRLEAAEILFQQGMAQDAIAWLKTILQHDEQHPAANRLLAKHYRESGQLELAEEHLRLGSMASGP
jgi:predicted Zn-dependent protease